MLADLLFRADELRQFRGADFLDDCLDLAGPCQHFALMRGVTHEYRALIKGLELCARHTRGIVRCFLDSEPVVKQIVGGYRLKNEDLMKQLERVYKEVIYQHVPRTNRFIKEADRMVNEGF